MTVAALKKVLKENELAVSGRKAELIQRLEDAGVGQEGAEEDEEEAEEEEEVEEEAAPAPAPAKKAATKTPAKKAPAKKAPAKKATAKKATAKKAKAGGSIFEIGEAVEGFYEDDNDWFPGRVTKDLGGGKFAVEWDEDSEKYNLEPGYIRKPISEVDRNGPFLPGEAVQALCEEDDSWYGGILQEDNGDGTFKLLWDEDGEEYTAKQEFMKKVAPPVELEELEVGQQLKGVVSKLMPFGAFADVGASRDGLIHISNMIAPSASEPAFQEGDHVTAYYKEDDDWYGATVDKVNKDGSYVISWDEDGDEPHTAKEAEMKADGPRMPVKVNDVVDLWVSKVEEGRLGLSMFQGAQRPPGAGIIWAKRDVSGFANMDENQFIDGKVTGVRDFGLFVEIEAPDGAKGQGLVHVSRMRDGFVEDIHAEAELGQDVQVRVMNVDVENGKLQLSMV